METKKLMLLLVGVGGFIGGWLGTILDHGNSLGPWTLLLSTLGGITGLVAGYKLGNE